MDEKLLARLMETFLGELEEHVAALNRDLLALEKDPPEEERAEFLKTLFRSAHSLKGAARAVNVTALETLCHGLEDILGAAREGALLLGPEHFELLFAAADAINDTGKRLRSKEGLEDGPLGELTRRLAKAPRGGGVSERVASEPTDEGEAAPTKRPTVSVAVAGESATVRIPAQKLDTLLAQSGELLLARHRMESRRETLGGLHDFVHQWETEWRGVEKLVGQIMERALKGGSNGGLPSHAARRAAPPLSRVGENLRRLGRDLQRLNVGLAQDERLLGNATSGIDTEVRSARMLPFAEACEGLERAVRDLAKAGGKKVDLSVVGARLEMDRSILEALKDPLLHLVRNAVDHGIEPVQERKEAGKPARAKVAVSAALQGSRIQVTVSDDGSGLDLDAVRLLAVKKNVAVPQDDQGVARLVFLPGFSTSPLITEVSGRGVGLDVVKSRVEAMRGSVDIATEPGRGSRFTLTIPLTLTTLRVILVKVGEQVYAFDTSHVTRLRSVREGDFRMVEGREMILVGSSPIPIASLAATLGPLGPTDRARPAPGTGVPALVVGEGDSQVAFSVEELIAEREVVVRALGARLKCLPHVSGGTLLPTGEVALILSVPDLVRTALGRPTAGLASTLEGGEPEAKKRILAVDDSVTARSLMQSVLEDAGYEVTMAVDGAEAWDRLQEGAADLVISDVEMPRMDGFALTDAIRKSGRFRDLPVVLVTARSSDQDRARGLEVGANAYLVKSTFDQQSLLDAIDQLL